MKSRNLQPRLLYPAKISFRIGGQVKSFPDQEKKEKKKNLKEFIITKPLLYEMLKGLKKKTKTMNNKIAKNINLSTTESKKQTEKTRTKTESWIQRAF